MTLGIYTAAAWTANSGLQVAAGATVEVRTYADGQPLAAIKADREGATGKDNPFTADAQGRFAFFAAGGAYRIKVTDGELEQVLEYQAVGTAGEADTGTTADELPTNADIFLESNLTVQIPTDYATLQDAVDDLSRYRVKNGVTITLNIESGHQLTSGLLITGGDYGYFVVTATDQEVLVDTANYSGARYQGPLLEDNWSDVANTDNLFLFVNCLAPVIACRINMQSAAGNGVTIVNSRLQVAAHSDQGEPTADSYGVINAGANGLLSVSSGVIFARATVWDGAGERGVRLTASSIAEMQWATANDCGISGFFASRGSVLHAFRCSANNGVQFGVQVHRSFAVVDGGQFQNAGIYGIRAINAATVSAGFASGIGGDVATNVSGSAEGVFATDGSTVHVGGGANADGCGRAVNARRGSTINASDMIATNCTDQAVVSFQASNVNFADGDATGSNGGVDNVIVLQGSTVSASGAVGADYNIAVNTVTGNGIIYD